jgi:hypothetical protein
MLNKKKFYKLKKRERIIKPNNNIYSPMKSNDSSINQKSLSLSELIRYSPLGRNKTKLMITSLLSSSKGIVINKETFGSSKIFPKKSHHFYPYRPNSSINNSNLSHSQKRTKLILSSRINDSIYNIKDNQSPKDAFSFDMSLPMTPKYKINNRYCKVKKDKLLINEDYLNYKPFLRCSKNKKNNFEICKNNSNEKIIIEDKIPINEQKFVNIIDEINKDNNYINKIKKELKLYYFINDENSIGTKYFFEKLSLSRNCRSFHYLLYYININLKNMIIF